MATMRLPSRVAATDVYCSTPIVRRLGRAFFAIVVYPLSQKVAGGPERAPRGAEGERAARLQLLDELVNVVCPLGEHNPFKIEDAQVSFLSRSTAQSQGPDRSSDRPT